MPLVGTDFFVNFALTRTLILGVAASSIVFLSSSVGMVSLAQYLLVGVAGFTIGNCVAESGKGLKLGLNPWLAIVIALAVSVLVALVLGAIGSRPPASTPHAHAHVRRHRLLRVQSGDVISGFGGITGVDPPGFFHEHGAHLLRPPRAVGGGVCRVAGAAPHAVRAQPGGDPRRPGADGRARLQRALHRTLASPWPGPSPAPPACSTSWNRQSTPPRSPSHRRSTSWWSPSSAASGTSRRLAGAFVYVVANNYLRSLPLVDHIGITEPRFNTVVGRSCCIVVLSPEGLSGIFAGLFDRVSRPRSAPLTPATAGGPAAPSSSTNQQPTSNMEEQQ